jgi:hypothetical protein
MPSPRMVRNVALVRTDGFGGKFRLSHQGEYLRLLRLLVIAYVAPSPPILITLMMEALRSSDTSVLTRATQCNIPEDSILHSHRCGNIKSYIALTGWTL